MLASFSSSLLLFSSSLSSPPFLPADSGRSCTLRPVPTPNLPPPASSRCIILRPPHHSPLLWTYYSLPEDPARPHLATPRSVSDLTTMADPYRLLLMRKIVFFSRFFVEIFGGPRARQCVRNVPDEAFLLFFCFLTVFILLL